MAGRDYPAALGDYMSDIRLPPPTERSSSSPVFQYPRLFGRLSPPNPVRDGGVADSFVFANSDLCHSL